MSQARMTTDPARRPTQPAPAPKRRPVACSAGPSGATQSLNASSNFVAIPTFAQIGGAPVLQKQLAVGRANDPLEHEADIAAERVMAASTAERVMGAADPLVSRNVSEPRLSRECAACEAEEEKRLQRKSAGSETSATAPPIVHDVLRTPGQPLDAQTRSFMEPRFRRSFADVRVHADPAAAASARAVNATAYTVGNRIAFDAGRYAPYSHAGRRLLAHELTHVVQQSSTRGATALQREENTEPKEEPVPSFIGNQLVAKITDTLPLGTSSRIASTALLGFVTGAGKELFSGGKGRLLISAFGSFGLKNVPEVMLGYTVGVVEGIVSPITDLFALGQMAEHLNAMSQDLMIGALLRSGDLAKDLQELLPAVGEMKKKLHDSFAGAAKDPLGTIGALVAGQTNLSVAAEKKAYQFAASHGREFVDALVEPLDKPKAAEAEPTPSKHFFVTDWIAKGAESIEGKVLNVPWSKMGSKLGYAVGWAAINAAMLLLSEGIGNAIVEVAGEIGKASKLFGAFEKAIGGAAKVLETLGEVIGKIGKFTDEVMTGLLKPLEPLLKPFMEIFEPFLKRLRTFLKKLLGVAEKEVADKAVTTVAKEGASLADQALAPKPQAHVPPTHVPPPKPAVVAPHPLPQTPHPTGHVPDAAPITHPTKPLPKPADLHAPNGELHGAGAKPDIHPVAVPDKTKAAQDAVGFVDHNPNAVKGAPGKREADIPGPGNHKVVEVESPAGIHCEYHSASGPTVLCPTGMGHAEVKPNAAKPQPGKTEATPGAPEKTQTQPTPTKSEQPVQPDAWKNNRADGLRRLSAQNEKRLAEIKADRLKHVKRSRELYEEADLISKRRTDPNFWAESANTKAKAAREAALADKDLAEELRLQRENQGIRDELRPRPPGPNVGQPHGGPYNNMGGPYPGWEKNHIPPVDAYKGTRINSDKGPALWMEEADHAKTASWGSGKTAQNFRAQQRALIQQGRFMEALEMDIADLKRLGIYNKYEKGIQEMIAYAKTLNPRQF